MSKVVNFGKAVAIVAAGIATLGLAATLIALLKVAKGAGLVLLAILLAIAMVVASVWLVYNYLEGRK